MEPPRTVESYECSADPSAERAECPTCGKTFAGGAIVDGEPVWSDDHACMLMLRRFYCDHCHQVIAWREVVTPGMDGEKTGVRIDKAPGIVRGCRSVAMFLARFPGATGVQQR